MDTRDILSTAVNGHRGPAKESSPITDYEELDEISTIGKCVCVCVCVSISSPPSCFLPKQESSVMMHGKRAFM